MSQVEPGRESEKQGGLPRIPWHFRSYRSRYYKLNQELGDCESDTGVARWLLSHPVNPSVDLNLPALDSCPTVASNIEQHEFDYSFMITYRCAHGAHTWSCHMFNGAPEGAHYCDDTNLGRCRSLISYPCLPGNEQRIFHTQFVYGWGGRARDPLT